MAGRPVDDTMNFFISWIPANPPYVIFKWQIENFSSAKNLMKSPCFEISQSSKWNLILDPYVEVGHEVFVKIYLRRNPRCIGHTARTRLTGEFSVHGPDNELLSNRLFEEIYDAPSNNSIEFLVSRVSFVKSSNKCCGSDNFVIRCEMILSHERNHPSEWIPHLEKFSSDMRKLVGDEKFSDVSICASDDVVNVHSVILSARSPVLCDILKVSSKYINEDTENSLHISAVLYFLYTANPDFLFSSSIVGIYGQIARMAKKWELHELENLLTPARMHCATRIKQENFLFTWQINNFSRQLTGTGSNLQSSEFITTDENGTKWKLILEKSMDNNIGLFLVKNSGNLSHKVEVEFKLCNSHNNAIVVKSREYMFGSRSDQMCGFTTMCSQSFLQNEITNNDDTLNVECKMKFRFDLESWIQFTARSSDKTDEDPFVGKYVKTLSCNLKYLYKTKKGADLKICTDKEQYSVHKAIMWARSPYFSSLLDSHSAEYIALPIDDDILKEILLYIYSAELPRLNIINALKLYEASILLKLELLISECRAYLLINITVDDVLEIMAFAHRIGDTELELECEKFASTPGNAKLIISTVRWQTFLRKYNTLAIRIYHNLAWSYCNGR